MPEPEPVQRTGAGVSPADFESLYRGGGARFGPDGRLLEVIPWQLDGPQPVITELEAAGEIVDPVLECGCGLGDNALFLARQGYSVTAFDAAATAVETSRDKADAAGVRASFLVADATTLQGIRGGFRTVIDSAMMHCLSDPDRTRYLAALRRVCTPDARIHVLCFDSALAGNLPLPGSLDEQSLRAAFNDGWTLERMRPARYTTGLTRHDLTERVPAEMRELLPIDDAVDEAGRMLLPIWQITARAGR